MEETYKIREKEEKQNLEPLEKESARPKWGGEEKESII